MDINYFMFTKYMYNNNNINNMVPTKIPIIIFDPNVIKGCGSTIISNVSCGTCSSLV